jgi:hypothetical protein
MMERPTLPKPFMATLTLMLNLRLLKTL